MNIITTVQKVTEQRARTRPLSSEFVQKVCATPGPSAVECIGKLQEVLDVLNVLGFDFFDTCAALSITDDDALHRFIQLVLKDKQ